MAEGHDHAHDHAGHGHDHGHGHGGGGAGGVDRLAILALIRSFTQAGELLDRIGVPCETDIWGYESFHDWPWWKRQAMHHFGRIFA